MARRRSRVVPALGLVVACAFGVQARAATARAQLAPAPGPASAAPARPAQGYWSAGRPRFFLSSKSDAGTFYLKPSLSAGYGVPQWLWCGVDAIAITTLEFGQVYGGLRLSSPVLDLAWGARDSYSYQKRFVAPQAHYHAEDLLGGGEARARYWAWEFEAAGVVPLPYSALILDYVFVNLLDVPEGREVYDESYRAVIANSTFHVLRTAAVARLLGEGALKIGLLGELIVGAGRGQPVLRIGPAAALQITDHLEALFTVSFAVSSPDRLGLVLGTYGLAGVRYRWATGEPSPKLPWQGPPIPW